MFSFYIETLGCPKNIVDSRRMRTVLRQAGFQESKTSEEADFILVNSCAFIQDAQQETIETTFDYLNQIDDNQKIGLIGCFTERFPDEIKKEIPEIHFTMGTNQYHKIAEIISNKFNITIKTQQVSSIDKSYHETFQLPYAFFRIAQGCSKKCSFCAIPEIRGSFQAYSLENIKQQYEEEVMQRKHPLREVVLVSQDTVSQNINELKEIIDFFSEKKHIKRIRLQYLFPDKKVFKILKLMKENEKVMPYLDIPFQHFSEKILKKMNRPHDISLFEDIISVAKETMPTIEIRTSLIIGYPSETEEDIEKIFDFLKKNQIHKLILFKYSHEAGTFAEQNFEDDVLEEDKVDRINRINDFFLSYRKEYRNSILTKSTDKPINLMVDKINEHEIITRREQDSPEADEIVFIDYPNEDNQNDSDIRQIKIGDIVTAKLTVAMEYDWVGELV